MYCIMRLSVKTEPFVRTFAIDAISPNANKSTEMLAASSNTYKMAVSSFSMEGNCFTGRSFLGDIVRSIEYVQAVEHIVQDTKFDVSSAWSFLASDRCCVRSHPPWPRSPVGQALA